MLMGMSLGIEDLEDIDVNKLSEYLSEQGKNTRKGVFKVFKQ